MVTAVSRGHATEERMVDVLAAVADVVPEGYRVESVEGEIYVTPPALPEHRDDIEVLEDSLRAMNVGRVGMAKEFSSGLVGDDIRPYAIPDLYVQARETDDMDRAWARAHDNYFPLAMLALVVEVTSPSTRDRDFGAKLRTYAGAGVPVYVIVDRKNRVLVVHHEPDPEKRCYAAVATVPYGTAAPMPKPFADLDTSLLV
ncbi:Uma2 family endonuclease [Embleya sp. NPDC050493]|uniref:Uma2 family endonuclease n=1 Tax=Embleya sp. NPDC050493 TaxID=3363989 RepID=UPI0037979813